MFQCHGKPHAEESQPVDKEDKYKIKTQIREGQL
jgi:hypothetical protein